MFKHTLHRDYETKSAVDLRTCGIYVYAEDPSTDVWCMAYRVDDGPVLRWQPGDPVPQAFIDCAESDDWEAVAHNNQFEFEIEAQIMTPRYGFPRIPLHRQRCTMAAALAMALPGSLDNAAAALGLDVRKDVKGYGVMMRMAKPRKIFPPEVARTMVYGGDTQKGRWTLLPDGRLIEWWADEERFNQLRDYNDQDVVVECLLDERLMRLSPSELEMWHLDQVINSRGVFVDEALCLGAKAIVKGTQARLDEQMKLVTDYGVSACTNAVQLASWVRAKGFEVDSIAKDKIDVLLARDDLPDDVRQALTLRREAAKASVAKIDSLLAGMQRDKRSRGLLQYHAASTGRWGGRRFQPQNIKRPKIKDIDTAIDVVMTGDLDYVDMIYGEPLSVVGDCLRGMIRAAPGNKIIAADFANIEGRVLAWLAGEDWKMQAFRDFDDGVGPDLYKVAYGRSFGVDPASIGRDDPERQIGKVMELALGYQGGPGAFQTMARGYGVDIGENYDRVTEQAGLTIAAKAAAGWASRGKTSGMTETRWRAAEIVKILWREAHPNVIRFWWDLDAAGMEAVENPGLVINCGPVRLVMKGSFLWLRLPSGRALCYPYPKLVMKDMPWEENDKPARRQVFSYKGVDSYTRKWTDCYAYGGLWAENVTQAVARDVMADAIKRLEKAKYPVILSVHDEVVCEVPEGFGSVDQFCAIMTELPTWAEGLPIAAEGFSAARYRK